LKQAAVASSIENKDKEKPIATNDTFQKYKMQLIEKERALKEQEQKLQKEKELQKAQSVNLDENKPSPSSSSNQQPISPYQVQQNSVPASNTSDFDSNSQLSPPPPPPTQSDSVLSTTSKKRRNNTSTIVIEWG